MWKPEPTHIHSYPTLGHYSPVSVKLSYFHPAGKKEVFRRNGTTF
ncbi:hypothetical protein JL09_g6740 [Pichia kudriavzevii]|uniref:Uncharacterized protein n=1 Tax=Pichia kudriavzevii TaxID=4909 RepID=A0A099NIW6_PICKU|nr:hypothetical protein JL09_g6740 [Pichia kudriavzevii]